MLRKVKTGVPFGKVRQHLPTKPWFEVVFESAGAIAVAAGKWRQACPGSNWKESGGKDRSVEKGEEISCYCYSYINPPARWISMELRNLYALHRLSQKWFSLCAHFCSLGCLTQRTCVKTKEVPGGLASIFSQMLPPNVLTFTIAPWHIAAPSVVATKVPALVFWNELL